MAKYSESTWRSSILQSIQKRNKTEHQNIQDLIITHNRLFDHCESMRQENNQLHFQNEKLRQELSQAVGGTVPSKGIVVQGDMAVYTQRIQTLEQKLYMVQEELTDLHREKSQNAQQVVNLNHMLQESDKKLQETKHKLDEKETELMFMKESLSSKEAEAIEANSLVQLLKDEYQALNLIYNSLEDKYKKAQEEISQLVERWMVLKERDAERLNAENDAALKEKQENLEKKLKEAAEEQKLVVEENNYACYSPICVSTSLPTRCYMTFEAHDTEVNAVQFSPQGRLLATGGADRRIKLWDISHGTIDERGMLTGSNAGVNAIDFDGEDSLILGASNDFASRVWSVRDLRLRHTLTGHSGKVMAAKFFGESSRVVTGSHDRTLKVWDLRSRSCVRTLFAGSSCNDIAIASSQASAILSAHFDKRIRFWDTRNEQPTATLTLQGKITSLGLSQEGFYLLASARDDTLRVIDLRQNSIIKVFSHQGFHLGCDFSRAGFSPDGAYAACGSSDGHLFIWNVWTEKLERELTEHDSCLVASSWHPEGKCLVTCDRTRKVAVWGNV